MLDWLIKEAAEMEAVTAVVIAFVPLSIDLSVVSMDKLTVTVVS